MTNLVERDVALSIWRSAVQAVDSTHLVRSRLSVSGSTVRVASTSGGASVPSEEYAYSLGETGRLIVVGAGKAGSGMAQGVEVAIRGTPIESRTCGWVNVPEDCVRPTNRIVLHGARPAGLNEPTLAGCQGTRKILSLVQDAAPQDLVLVLISGGGSALLPGPIDGITLEDKQRVTRLLSTRGANIRELNTVRRRLSTVKGGGLARGARCPMIALIISDVIGDPLDVIASGPTVDIPPGSEDALTVLERFDPDLKEVPPRIVATLKSHRLTAAPKSNAKTIISIVEWQNRLQAGQTVADLQPPVMNLVIGNNEVACGAAVRCAQQLGFETRLLGVGQAGDADQTGTALVEKALEVRTRLTPGSKPVCLVSGGEPVVRLTPTDVPRKGGRNQQLVLAAHAELLRIDPSGESHRGLVILSGGTDGEDGPTDAAGAVLDASVADNSRTQGLNPLDFLRINNAYAFFESTGGLVITGPTHTNTMDVRIVLIAPPAARSN